MSALASHELRHIRTEWLAHLGISLDRNASKLVSGRCRHLPSNLS
jgi:hypothetical protein